MNITVTIRAHPEPTFVYWLFRYDQNTAPVKIPQTCTTYGLARYACSLVVKEANSSDLGIYVLHFENEIGAPLNVQFEVKGKGKLLFHLYLNSVHVNFISSYKLFIK